MSDSVRPQRWQPTRLRHPWDSPGKNTGVGCHFLLQCMKVKSESKVTQSCPTLSDLMDCSLPGSSAHGIFQARVLEWGAIAFSKFGKLSSGHRTGKGQFSFQSQIRAMSKNVQTTIALISHTSKIMLKIFQARLQQYMHQARPDVQVEFRKGRVSRDQIANIH